MLWRNGPCNRRDQAPAECLETGHPSNARGGRESRDAANAVTTHVLFAAGTYLLDCPDFDTELHYVSSSDTRSALTGHPWVCRRMPGERLLRWPVQRAYLRPAPPGIPS